MIFAQDSSAKQLGAKLLLSRLKQEAMKAQIHQNDNKIISNDENMKCVGTFVSPSESNIEPTNTATLNPEKCSQINKIVDLSVDDAVEWEDGYSSQNIKAFGSDSSQSNSDNDDIEQWDIPFDSDQIDLTVLASLPTQMRKDLIEETRRKERSRKRSYYLPVATDPHLYSQTQIANFLRTR
jgi:hypothetical protein